MGLSPLKEALDVSGLCTVVSASGAILDEQTLVDGALQSLGC